MLFHIRSLLLFIYWLILIDYECHAIKLFIESLLYIWFIPAVKLQSVTITQSVEVMLSLLWLFLFLFFIYSTGLCQLYYSINIREDANQVSVFFSCPVWLCLLFSNQMEECWIFFHFFSVFWSLIKVWLLFAK